MPQPPVTPAEVPIFKKSLRKTHSDGTYSGIRSNAMVRVFRDRIEIDGRKIYWPYVKGLRVYGEVLHVVYVLGDGRPVEEYFRNVTFAGSAGARELAAMLAQVAPELERAARAAASAASASAEENGSGKTSPTVVVRRVSREAGRNGRSVVTVHSSRVAFPLLCPTCAQPATRIAGLSMAGLFERGGWWAVPVCDKHRSVKQSVDVVRWAGSEITLASLNARWADAFASMNEETPDRGLLTQAQSSPLAFSLSTGSRFVVYRQVVSFVYVSFSTSSEPVEIRRGASKVSPSLPHSLFTLLLGWWSIPGLIATPLALIANFRGGIDVTANVQALVAGAPLSPRGV